MKEKTNEQFDVVAVNIDKGTVRIIERNKSLDNAEAIVSMAVMRRGVELEFYSECHAGEYQDGDKWNGED